MQPEPSTPLQQRLPAEGSLGGCEPCAVLCSGGLDSAILVADLASRGVPVVPIYVRFGLIWEEVEERALRRYLAALNIPTLQPLRVFEMSIQSVYGPHWSTTGEGIPDAQSPDAAVFLPGRNLLLFAQPAVWCHLQGWSRIALGILAGNPFADASDEYFETLQRAINLALSGQLQFIRPYRQLQKREVLECGRAFPLELTLSCIFPVGELHCGACNKCAERQQAFSAAGLPDPTTYAV